MAAKREFAMRTDWHNLIAAYKRRRAADRRLAVSQVSKSRPGAPSFAGWIGEEHLWLSVLASHPSARRKRMDGAPIFCWELNGDGGEQVQPASLAALLAAGHNGGVEAFAEVGGKVVDLVGTIDFNGFAG